MFSFPRPLLLGISAAIGVGGRVVGLVDQPQGAALSTTWVTCTPTAAGPATDARRTPPA